MSSEAFASMNAALQERALAVQKLLGEAAVAEVGTRYEAATIIRTIQDEHGTYGERAVESLASALGRDDATLYRYAAVARAWADAEMRRLCRRCNCFGEPLSWSHWTVLARLTKWRPWLERTLTKGWSVRRLKEKLTASKREGRTSRVLDPEETTQAALLESTKDVERWNAQLTSSIGPAIDRLGLSPTRSPQVERQVARLRDGLAEMSRKVDELKATLPAASASEPVRNVVPLTGASLHRGLVVAGGVAQRSGRPSMIE